MKLNWKYIAASLGILALELYQQTVDNKDVEELEKRVKQLEQRNTKPTTKNYIKRSK